MVRFENKYLLENKIQKFTFIKFLIMNGFYSIYKKRHNQSVYFDDKDCSFFHSSEEGEEIRRKIRFRYYDNDSQKDISNFYLQIKKSNTHFKEKISYKFKDIHKSFDKELNMFINQIDIKKLKPVIKTSYIRSYFYSEKYGRITLDEDIIYEKASWKIFKKNFLFYNSVRTNKIIIEHKIEKNYQNFDHIPLTKTRYSKYCEAIKLLNIR